MSYTQWLKNNFESIARDVITEANNIASQIVGCQCKISEPITWSSTVQEGYFEASDHKYNKKVGYKANLDNEGAPFITIIHIGHESSYTSNSRRLYKTQDHTEIKTKPKKQCTKCRKPHDRDKSDMCWYCQAESNITNATTKVAHPYLNEKKIPLQLATDLGIKQFGNIIYIPVTNAVGWQTIDTNGKKFWAIKDEMKGAYIPIGKYKDGEAIYIAEGFATAVSGYLSTNMFTIAAMQLNNIPNVLSVLKEKHDKANFVILVDNDIKSDGTNPGVTGSLKYAKKFKCQVSIPPSTDKKVDWNDVYCELGAEKTRQLILENTKTVKDKIEIFKVDLSNPRYLILNEDKPEYSQINRVILNGTEPTKKELEHFGQNALIETIADYKEWMLPDIFIKSINKKFIEVKLDEFEQSKDLKLLDEIKKLITKIGSNYAKNYYSEKLSDICINNNITYKSNDHPYIVRDNCIFMTSEKSNGEPIEIKLLHGNAIIVSKIYCDNADKTTQFVIRACEQNKSLDTSFEILVDVNDFKKMEWLSKFILDVEPPRRINLDYLRDAIIKLSGDIPSVYKFTKLGINDLKIGNNTHKIYITNNRVIGIPENFNMETAIEQPAADNNMSFYQLPLENDNGKAKAGFMLGFEMSDKIPVGILLTTLVHMSPLYEFINPDFVTLLHAKTNNFKSVISALYLGYQGKWSSMSSFEAYHYMPTSFRMTRNAIMKTASKLSHHLVVVDDWYGEEEHKKSLGELNRAVGNRAGRSRLSHNGEKLQKEQDIPRSPIVVTAEYIPSNLHESELTRLICVEIEQFHNITQRNNFGDTLSDLYSKANVLPYHYASYVQWILEKYEQLPDWVNNNYNENIKIFKNSIYPRQAASFAKLLTAYYIMLSYGVDKGYITDEESYQKYNEALEYFFKIMNRVSKTVQEENPTRKLITFLQHKIDSVGIIYEGLVGKQYTVENVRQLEPGKKHFGYSNDKYVYIFPELIQDILADKKNSFQISYKEMLCQLKDNKYIDPSQNANTFVIKAGDKENNIRMVRFFKDKIFMEADHDENC